MLDIPSDRMTLHEIGTMARTTLTRLWASGPTTWSTSWTVATEAPLAEAGSPLGRLWNPLDIAVSAVVDTARNGPLTVRHGDSDDPGFRGSGSRAEGAIMASGAAAVAAPEWRETVFPAGAYT